MLSTRPLSDKSGSIYDMTKDTGFTNSRTVQFIKSKMQKGLGDVFAIAHHASAGQHGRD